MAKSPEETNSTIPPPNDCLLGMDAFWEAAAAYNWPEMKVDWSDPSDLFLESDCLFPVVLKAENSPIWVSPRLSRVFFPRLDSEELCQIMPYKTVCSKPRYQVNV